MGRRNKGPFLKWVKERQTWYIYWYEGGRERKKSTGTGNCHEAEQQLSRHIIDLDQPTDVLSHTRRLLADVMARYGLEHAVHVASAATIGHNMKCLVPFWGTKTVADVRPVMCREYLRYRLEKAKRLGMRLSEATVSRELGVLAAAINHDYKQGRIATPVPV